MDPISLAISRVKSEIPRDILNQAFMPKRYDPSRNTRYQDNVNAASLDELIRLQVIEHRVMVDINLVSGTEVFIPMMLAEREVVDRWNAIYRFGPEATGGRRITAVHEVTYGLVQSNYTAAHNVFDARGSQSLASTRDIIRAAAGSSPVSTAYVQLVGINTVLVNDLNLIASYGAVRCTVTNEPNLGNLQPPYYRNFGDLVVLATKAHVYNTLIIELDESQLRAGMSIGRFREIVDSYADANQMYNEYIDTRWEKIGNINDTEKFRKVMKLALGAKHRY